MAPKAALLQPDGPARKKQRRERVQALSAICPTLTLVCEDGELPVCGEVLRMASPDVLNGAIEAAHNTKDAGSTTAKLKVKGSTEDWIEVLSLLYPDHPQRDFTCELVLQVLPLVHEFNMAGLLSSMRNWVVTKLPYEMDTRTDKPSCVFKWLRLAEQLQLDDMKNACLGGMPRLAHNFAVGLMYHKDQLRDQALQLSPGLMFDVFQMAFKSD